MPFKIQAEQKRIDLKITLGERGVGQAGDSETKKEVPIQDDYDARGLPPKILSQIEKGEI